MFYSQKKMRKEMGFDLFFYYFFNILEKWAKLTNEV